MYRLVRVTGPIVVSLLILLGLTWAPQPSVLARRAAQTSFPPGAVVSLNGTPHLWIADSDGMLHWGGDTRALQGRIIDWNTRIPVSLDTLRTLALGDPWLSAGLLKDGTPIYLVKWESTDAVPRLQHIQSICDVELFGINASNYGNYVLDRDQWEAKFHVPVSTLQRGELAATDPSAAGCGTPTPTSPTPQTAQPYRITITPSDLAALSSTLSANGLSVDRINVARTTTFATIGTGGTNGAPVVLAAPLTSAPNQTLSNVTGGATVPIGVLQAGRPLTISGGRLDKNIYLVRVVGGKVVFTNPQGHDTVSSRGLDARHLARPLSTPQTILTIQDVCFGWNDAQVCTDPSPMQSLNQSEKAALQGTMGAARDALKARGLLPGDINSGVTMSEAEGTGAASQKQANIVAAPADSLPDVTQNGPPPDDTFIGILVVVGQPVNVPNYPSIPPGQYAVQSEVGGTQAVLLASDGGEPLPVPMRTLQVRGAPSSGDSEQPLTIIAHLCLGAGGDSDLCMFGEPD